jgi:4'-phosphopantetheinyl transferase
LGDCLETTPEKVPLLRAADDAVDVAGTDWQVSISHSGPHAIAGCARHRVGVDLERIQSRDPAIAQFLFAPEDRGLVDELPYDFNAGLILCWTLKEAVLKARRTGFRTSPKDLHLQVQPEREAARVEVKGEGAWPVFFFRQAVYWAAVALPAD